MLKSYSFVIIVILFLHNFLEGSISKPLLIIETGHAFEEVVASQGDFSDLIIKQLPTKLTVIKCNDIAGETLPNMNDISGVILTGSSAMVTDYATWSETTAT